MTGVCPRTLAAERTGGLMHGRLWGHKTGAQDAQDACPVAAGGIDAG